MSQYEDCLAIARTVSMPEWATHVAVFTLFQFAQNPEPCAWVESHKIYVDRPPISFNGAFPTVTYNMGMWQFFSREEVFGTKGMPAAYYRDAEGVLRYVDGDKPVPAVPPEVWNEMPIDGAYAFQVLKDMLGG